LAKENRLLHTKVANIEQSLPPLANSSLSFGFPLEDRVDGNIEWYIHTSLESTQQLISCSFAHLLGNCIKGKKKKKKIIPKECNKKMQKQVKEGRTRRENLIH
jgi:hypothetical protein